MQYAKAILAGLIALVGGIAVGYTDESLTKGEFWAAAAAGLVALGSVFQVPNAEADEDGLIDRGLLYFLAAIALILCILALVGVDVRVN